MADMFDELSQWVNERTKAMSDGERRQLAKRITTKVRNNWKKRIRSQRDSSGAKFTPRKRNQKGRIRRGALFSKLPRFIKTSYSSSKAEIGFKGRLARQMEVHQYGQMARPSKFQDPVRYDVREVVGFSDEDIQTIKDEIEKFMIGD